MKKVIIYAVGLLFLFCTSAMAVDKAPSQVNVEKQAAEKKAETDKKVAERKAAAERMAAEKKEAARKTKEEKTAPRQP